MNRPAGGRFCRNQPRRKGVGKESATDTEPRSRNIMPRRYLSEMPEPPALIRRYDGDMPADQVSAQ